MIPIYAQSELFDTQENFSDRDGNRALAWVKKLGPNYDFEAPHEALVAKPNPYDGADGTLIRTGPFFSAGAWTDDFDLAAQRFVERVFGKQ